MLVKHIKSLLQLICFFHFDTKNVIFDVGTISQHCRRVGIRWYDRFIGSLSPIAVKKAIIAEKIAQCEWVFGDLRMWIMDI